ncbi:motility associated factor glycosyltransferase family protein [Campylobacter cuniculorum]|uniref:motility associated factor glycosyltransferase family protein n=1 Tax=Campylobacter cuniculorum TaxID=374106 RepID=UPI0023F22E69|nr:motility associated factor glycosyltransferase family protein [Campylobacter cuniculorum]
MRFSTELFLANTQALFEVDEILAYQLRKLQTPYNFTIKQDETGLNFINKQGVKLYENPMEKTIQDLAFFKENYSKYPILFFYGFGNGLLYKLLTENEKHKHIIVFESELEILALAFHFIDFTQELRNEKLILFYTPNLTGVQLDILLHQVVKSYVKTYDLNIHSDFYADFYSEQIKSLNTQITSYICNFVLKTGNDPKDSMKGIEHTIQNVPKMLTHGIFQEFLKQRKSKVKTAIIVATGPSLTKQLPLLKQYANKAAIFCADSSYPILAKNNIKPDYVLSLERGALTSEFFNNDFGAFDKDILFILASVVHKNTLKYLERKKCSYMIVSRILPFSVSLKLKEFGYLGVGFSVANMIFELCTALRFENILLIGQDLAYGEDGYSHTKDYQNLDKHKGDYERDFGKFTTTAYGGQGQVESSLVWTMFRQRFEEDVFYAKYKLEIQTYNCTEGGARIEGAIEMPFKEACETLLDEELKKPFEGPKILDSKKARKKLMQTQEKIQNGIIQAQKFIERVKIELKKLETELKKQEVDEENLKSIRQKLLVHFEKIKKLRLFNELLIPLYFHEECEVLRYEVLKDLEQEKKIRVFLEHLGSWFVEILAYLDTQNQGLKKFIEKWNFDDMDLEITTKG